MKIRVNKWKYFIYDKPNLNTKQRKKFCSMFQVTKFFDLNESKIFDLFSKSTVKWSLSKIKEILIDAAAQICRGKKMLLRL